MAIVNHITELVGNTPLLRLNKFIPDASVYAKLESFNPMSSAKDRAALYMINTAEKDGLLKAGGTIIEPTSGNTGIGLAYIGKSRGYNVVLVMPETMSIERRNMLAALGAELVLTPGADGMPGAIAKAKELVAEQPGAWMANQFGNYANVQAHYETTGPEIWRDTDGKVDVVVASAGTGGTITGVARFLKEKNPNIEIVVLEAKESPVLSGGKPGPHRIQGMSAGFMPDILDMKLMDRIYQVSSDDAWATTKELVITEGMFVGISSGGVAWSAKELSKEEQYKGKMMVCILPDSGDRYLSTGVFG